MEMLAMLGAYCQGGIWAVVIIQLKARRDERLINEWRAEREQI